MGKQELDNLVKIGSLKAEAASRKEFDGMVKSASRGLADSQNASIETDSQFDLACEAAHKLALAALRNQGYRSENRITVFQALAHTLATPNADLQIFLKPPAILGRLMVSVESRGPRSHNISRRASGMILEKQCSSFH